MTVAASRRQHKKFCDTEGWDEVRNARGKKVGHHITFELPLLDGRILRTRISRPANNDTYGPSLWSAILRGQLGVTEVQFWDCVDGRALPPRPDQAVVATPDGLPASLVHQLIHTLGISEEVIAAMDRAEAIDLMTEHWAKPTG